MVLYFMGFAGKFPAEVRVTAQPDEKFGILTVQEAVGAEAFSVCEEVVLQPRAAPLLLVPLVELPPPPSPQHGEGAAASGEESRLRMPSREATGEPPTEERSRFDSEVVDMDTAFPEQPSRPPDEDEAGGATAATGMGGSLEAGLPPEQPVVAAVEEPEEGRVKEVWGLVDGVAQGVLELEQLAAQRLLRRAVLELACRGHPAVAAWARSRPLASRVEQEDEFISPSGCDDVMATILGRSSDSTRGSRMSDLCNGSSEVLGSSLIPERAAQSATAEKSSNPGTRNTLNTDATVQASVGDTLPPTFSTALADPVQLTTETF